jgi:hypothetical protein
MKNQGCRPPSNPSLATLGPKRGPRVSNRDHNGSRSYPFPVWNGIFDHRRKIGPAVWEFLWCIDRVTREESCMGLVLGGGVIPSARIARELQDSERSVRRHLASLASGGYISLTRRPYGFVITVANSRKFDIWRSSKGGHSDHAKISPRVDKSAGQMAGFVRSNKEDSAVDSTQKQQIPPSPPWGGKSLVLAKATTISPLPTVDQRLGESRAKPSLFGDLSPDRSYLE